MAEENEGRWGDLGDRVGEVWDDARDWTKETWDNAVDSAVDSYEGTSDWTSDEVTEAKGYYKGRYDQYKEYQR